jgi:hypothetical protein
MESWNVGPGEEESVRMVMLISSESMRRLAELILAIKRGFLAPKKYLNEMFVSNKQLDGLVRPRLATGPLVVGETIAICP